MQSSTSYIVNGLARSIVIIGNELKTERIILIHVLNSIEVSNWFLSTFDFRIQINIRDTY